MSIPIVVENSRSITLLCIADHELRCLVLKSGISNRDR